MTHTVVQILLNHGVSHAAEVLRSDDHAGLRRRLFAMSHSSLQLAFRICKAETYSSILLSEIINCAAQARRWVSVTSAPCAGR